MTCFFEVAAVAGLPIMTLADAERLEGLLSDRSDRAEVSEDR